VGGKFEVLLLFVFFGVGWVVFAHRQAAVKKNGRSTKGASECEDRDEKNLGVGGKKGCGHWTGG